MKASNNRTRARRMVFHHLFLSLLCGASALLAACSGGGGGGDGGGGSSGDGGGGGTPAGTKLYYGYYVEDSISNPEDPTIGGVMLQIPAGDAAFAGQMPFSFAGCVTGSDIGAVSGNRSGASLVGSWSGTMDGTAVGGDYSGAYDAATDTFSGTYTNAAGKTQIAVNTCNYYVGPNGTWKLFDSPTSQPSTFVLASTDSTTPTFSWPSLGANILYGVRVFDQDCLSANISDPSCFKGEAFTSALTVSFPSGFPGASSLTTGVNYLVFVTAQDATTHGFVGYSSLILKPTVSGSGGAGGGGSSSLGSLTVTGTSGSLFGGSFSPAVLSSGLSPHTLASGPFCSTFLSSTTCVSGLVISWMEPLGTAGAIPPFEVLQIDFSSETNSAPGNPPGTGITGVSILYGLAHDMVSPSLGDQTFMVDLVFSNSGVTIDQTVHTVTFTNVELPGVLGSVGSVILNGTLSY